MKKILITGFILLLLGVGYFATRPKSNAQDQKEVKTAKVEKGPIDLSVSCTGSVTSNLDVEIKCKASGEIINLPFDISDPVKKGDLLLEIDPVDEERNVRLAEITLSSSQIKLQQAELTLQHEQKNLETERQRLQATLASAEATAKDESAKAKRMAELLAKKLTSQEDYDSSVTAEVQAKTSLETTKVQIEQLKMQEIQVEVQKQAVLLSKDQVERDSVSLAIAKRNRDDTRVFSPIDGVVVEKEIQIGQIISSGITNVGGGTTIMTVSDLSRIFILADVDESDIGNVRVGQKTKITVDAYPGTDFEGEVRIISPQGVNESNVVTFEVKIEVMSENKTLLKPEMTANVEIIANHKDDALILPFDAVILKNGKYYVEVAGENGQSTEREVQTGINDFTNVEIVQGVKLGESVVLYESVPTSQWRNDRGMPPPPGP